MLGHRATPASRVLTPSPKLSRMRVVTTLKGANPCRTSELKSGTIRVLVATLGGFGKWMVRRDKLVRNPVDRLTRPRRKARVLPCPPGLRSRRSYGCSRRERAILAPMAYGGLRRGEVAALDVGDVAPDFGLRRVMSKGGHEAPVALPARARAILRDYMATERAGLPGTAPLFVVMYRAANHRAKDLEARQGCRGVSTVTRIASSRAPACVWCRVTTSHEEPACRAGTAPPRRRADMTTGYTRLTQQDVRQALETLDDERE